MVSVYSLFLCSNMVLDLTELKTTDWLWFFLGWCEPGCATDAVLLIYYVAIFTSVCIYCTDIWTYTSTVWLSLLWKKHFSSCVGWEPGAFWFHRLVGHFEPCTVNCSSLTLLSCWNNRGEPGESELGIKEPLQCVNVSWCLRAQHSVAWILYL